MSKDVFEDTIFDCYEARTCDGNIVELIPNGSQIPVKWYNNNYICDLMLFIINDYDYYYYY